MKLGEVFQSASAWQCLASMKMSPKIAYKVLKYMRSVSAEYDIAEKQRVALIHELSGVPEGQPASIEAGTPEIYEYSRRFMEILETNSDLEPLSMSFGEVLEAISANQENVLSPEAIGLLEPFFAG